MPKQLNCPQGALLERLTTGQLSSTEIGQLCRHIEQCNDCASSFSHIARETDLEIIRRHFSTTQRPHADFEAWIAEVRQRGSENTGSSTDEKSNSFLCDTTTSPQAVRHEAGVAEFTFLSPPIHAGDIGQLGEYRIEKLLGRGGMGAVFKGFDPKLSRNVAIKVMLPEVASRSSLHDRFLREGRAMAAIKHDNIVSVYQVGEDAGVPYLVMEYLQGESLDQLLRKKGQIPILKCLTYAMQMTAGMAAAHSAGLIHRDIKPDNMWLEAGTNRIKLLDFGLARRLGDRPMTIDGTIMGTPGYMSPEQAQGLNVDDRTDLFSLGCVLYRMTTGRLPFDQSTLSAVCHQIPKPPIEYRSDISVAFSDLIMRLLSKAPTDRPQSANEVARTLTAITNREHESLSRSPTTLFERPVQQPVSRTRTRRVATGSLIVGVILLTAFFLPIWNTTRPQTVQDETLHEEAPSDTADANPKAAVKEPEFIRLFNGKNLNGFHIDGNPNSTWKVKSGELLGSWKTDTSGEGGSTLIADRDFRDYRLLVETMPAENWSCSIKILWNESVHQRQGFTRRSWYSIGIGSSSGETQLDTAKISRQEVEIKPKKPVKLPPNTWSKIEVEVVDTRIRVYVNEALKNEYVIPTARKFDGNIGISIAGGASLRIRRIDIKELSTSSTE